MKELTSGVLFRHAHLVRTSFESAAEADVSDETWQFPPGAIVRCERKRFSDGQVGMTAVERAEGG
jgi:hypothetical protein